MLVRLLVAVLMLSGPSPVRACTCAATASPPVKPADKGVPAVGENPREKSGCGCRDKSNPSSAGNTAPDDGTHDHASSPANHPGHQPHDRNCPAVTPHPVVSAVPPTPAADTPHDSDLGFLDWVKPVSGGQVRVAPREGSGHRPRAVPLYISLLTLRN